MATRGNRQTRRQLYPSHGGRLGSTRFQQSVVPNASISSFYGSRVPYEPRLLEQAQDDTDSDHWRPGETISSARFRNVYEDSDDGETRSHQEELWIDIKSFIVSEISKIEHSMTDMSQRIQGLEDNVGSLKKTVNEMMSDGNVSSSSVGSTPSSSKRKRKSPLGLQSRIRTIHKSFDEDNQLCLEETIDSAHNKQVVLKIQQEIGDDYSVDVIRAGINTYRKSLKRTPKEKESEKRARRSRQQRLWEHRSKFVSGDEQAKWEEVQPCMMSDEETRPDGRLARKRPCWRSDAFNNFMDELDSRADASLKQARKERVLSSPWKIASPSCCQDWMICTDPE